MAKTENPISALGRLVAGLTRRPVTATVDPLTPAEVALANEARWEGLKAALNAELPDMQAAGLSHDDTVKALRLLCGAEIREVETVLMRATLASGRLLGSPSPGRAMAVSRRVVGDFVANYAGQIRRRHGLGEPPPGRRFGPEPL